MPATVYEWARKLTTALQESGDLPDANSDQQQNGLAVNLVIDRATAARFGISASAIDSTLYDAFGQRQVSTIYTPFNQYHVVMEVAPQYWQRPETLKQIYVSTAPAGASGSQTTNLPAGVVVAPKASATTSASAAASVAADAARNAAMNVIGSSGKTAASSGSPVSTSTETMVPLSAFAHFESGARHFPSITTVNSWRRPFHST